MSSSAQEIKTQLNVLQQNYGIEPKDVLTLDGEPWLSSEQLAAIARQAKGFSAIEVDFKEFIPDLNQFIWTASMTDSEGRVYRRSGVATKGERLPTGEEVDENALAASRAMRSMLAMAGFDPFKGGSVVPIRSRTEEVGTRRNQLAELHRLAEQAGLIVPSDEAEGRRDLTEYRAFLVEHFGVNTAAGFSEQELEQAINKLRIKVNESDAVERVS